MSLKSDLIKGIKVMKRTIIQESNGLIQIQVKQHPFLNKTQCEATIILFKDTDTAQED